MNQAKRWTMFGKVNDTFTRIVVRPSATCPAIHIRNLIKSSDQPMIKVDWGDGRSDRYVEDQVDLYHSYEVTGGTFEIKINRALSALKIKRADVDSDNIAIISITSPFDITLKDSCFYDKAAVLTDSGAATMTSVNLRNVKNLTDGNGQVFTYQRALTSVNFDHLENVVGYSKGMFEGCSALPLVSMPKLTSLAERMFAGCSSLASVSFPLVTNIKGYALNATAITSMDSTSFASLTSIEGQYAIGFCRSLTSVNLPNVVVVGVYPNDVLNFTYASVNSQAFKGCTALASVSMAACQRIGFETFKDCSALTSVSMPNLRLLGGSAFAGCSTMTEISLPEVTRIGTDAFTGCTALRTVRLPKVQYIDSWIFADQGAVETVVDDISDYSELLDEWNRDYASEWRLREEYVQYYNGCDSLTDVYIDNMTVNEIRNIPCSPTSTVKAFPFGAPGGVNFHGSDGIITSSGNVTYND